MNDWSIETVTTEDWEDHRQDANRRPPLTPEQRAEHERRVNRTHLALCRALGADWRELVDDELVAYKRAARALTDAGATEKQLRERIAWWREHWELTLTPRALARHWATIGGHVREEQRAQRSRVRRTVADDNGHRATPEERAKVAQMLRDQTARMGRMTE